MTTPDARLPLAAEFPAGTRRAWQDMVRSVLEKAGTPVADETEPERALETATYDGITIEPLYTARDVEGLPVLPAPVRGGARLSARDPGWDVRARHADPDPVLANKAVHDDLAGGVTSLWIVVGDGGVAVDELDAVLEGVPADVAVVLDAGHRYRDAARRLLRRYADHGVDAERVTGGLGVDPLGVFARTGEEYDPAEAAAFVVAEAREYPSLPAVTVDALPYHDAGGSHAQELGASMAAGVAYLRELTDAGMTVEEAVGRLEFRYAADVDQFLTIAKLRAARRMWARVAEVCGVGAANAVQRQHAVTSYAATTARDPWMNVMRATIGCFSAAVAGADAITVLPFDAALGLPEEFSLRLARNTGSILAEESRLAAVGDPAGGSWYVERVTEDLARVAWDWFTEIERAGGLAAALRSGMVADRLEQVRQRREERISTRRDPITGVSEFPDVDEMLPSRRPAAARGSGGLPVVRYAEAFERLRDRCDAIAAGRGGRPAVFLAGLGSVAERSSVSAFATNLFGAGGIAVVDSGRAASTDELVAAFSGSGTTICCLCGTEAAYDDRAREVAAALRAAGASMVLLAGKRRDGVPDVDRFVHRGGDAVTVLTEILAEVTSR